MPAFAFRFRSSLSLIDTLCQPSPPALCHRQLSHALPLLIIRTSLSIVTAYIRSAFPSRVLALPRLRPLPSSRTIISNSLLGHIDPPTHMASQKIVAGGLVMSVGIRLRDQSAYSFVSLRRAPAIDSRSYYPLLSNRVRSLFISNQDMTESYAILMISAKNRSQL